MYASTHLVVHRAGRLRVAEYAQVLPAVGEIVRDEGEHLVAGTLRPHAIVRGRAPNESITRVRTFTGQAFQAPAAAQPLLVLPPGFISLMPEKPWQFGPETRRIPVNGWLQGAVMPFGSGRAAFFGEAAMFTAQVGGPEQTPMGMNAPMAKQNPQFVLNLMHWLSGILK